MIHPYSKRSESPFPTEAKHDKFDYVAFEQNYCFAPSTYKHGEFWGKFGLGGEVPSIVIALKGHYGHPHVFRSWLQEHIEISEKEISKIVGR